MQMETLYEKTDRILTALGEVPKSGNVPIRDMVSLWRSGLSSSLLFSVDEPTHDDDVEFEAQRIIARHVEGLSGSTPVSMSSLMDFQTQLQMRSKVISAIDMLFRG